MASCLQTHLAYMVWIAPLGREIRCVVNTLFAPGDPRFGDGDLPDDAPLSRG
jgi:hypothetical protein